MTLSEREKKMLVGAAIAIIIIYGYFMCWFGGPKAVIDLNWCPAMCLLNITDGGDDGCDTPDCTPLDDNFKAMDMAVYTAAQNACIGMGGSWSSTDTVVGCAVSSAMLDCDSLTAMPGTAVFMNDCRNLHGKFHCQSDWIGCLCVGEGNPPYTTPKKCDDVIDFSSSQYSSSCGGTCPTGATCTADRDDCWCEYPDGDIACESVSDSKACYDGECPRGQYCQPNIPMTGCLCTSGPM